MDSLESMHDEFSAVLQKIRDNGPNGADELIGTLYDLNNDMADVIQRLDVVAEMIYKYKIP